MKKLFHPAVGLWVLFSLICGVIVSNSAFTADMSAFLPRNPSPRQEILIDQISEGFASRALIVGLESAPAEQLAKMSALMGLELRQTGQFSSVSNGQSETSKKDQEFLFGNRYILSANLTADRMTASGLRTSIEDTLAEVASSTGLFSKALLVRDPTGESLEVIKQVIPTNQPAQVGGVWMNAGQSRALLLLQTKAQGSDLDAQMQAHIAIDNAFNKAKKLLSGQADAVVMKFSGPGVFAVNARDTIKTEAARLSTVGLFLVLCLLWCIYRSITTLFLGMLPVITGALAGVAAVGLGFPSVHGMTLGFGITLIGEAVDYAIYLFLQYSPQARLQNAPPSSQANIGPSTTFWPTIRLGVLTSIFGFSTMLFSGFTGLAQLGLFSIVGIVVAAITTRFLLPVLLPANFSARQPAKLGSYLSYAAESLTRSKGIVLVLAIAATGVLTVRWNTVWSTELGGLSPVPELAQKLDADLRGDIGAPDAGVLIVLKANSSESALQLSEDATSKLQNLVSKGVLGGFQSADKYLPSQRMQQLRKSQLPEDNELRARMAQALGGLPLRPDKLEQYFADVASTKNAAPLTRADLDGTSLSLGFDSMLVQNTKSLVPWTALIMLQAPMKNGVPTDIDISAVNNALSDWRPLKEQKAFVVEIKTEAVNVYKAYLREAIKLSFAGFVAIIALLSLVLRSVRRVLQVILPLLAAAVIVAASVVLLKGSISLLHLIGLLLVIAIGSNYALFFDRRSVLAAKAVSVEFDHNTLSSLFFANLTTVLGFGLLAFSSVPVMNAIGLTVGAGTFLALLFSAVFADQSIQRADFEMAQE
jgi:predicted exporter